MTASPSSAELWNYYGFTWSVRGYHYDGCGQIDYSSVAHVLRLIEEGKDNAVLLVDTRDFIALTRGGGYSLWIWTRAQ